MSHIFSNLFLQSADAEAYKCFSERFKQPASPDLIFNKNVEEVICNFYTTQISKEEIFKLKCKIYEKIKMCRCYHLRPDLWKRYIDCFISRDKDKKIIFGLCDCDGKHNIFCERICPHYINYIPK